MNESGLDGGSGSDEISMAILLKAIQRSDEGAQVDIRN